MEEELLTTKEIAGFLKVSEATVYRLAKRGDLPAIKVGKACRSFKRFRRSDLEAFLDRYTTRRIPKNKGV